MDTKKLVVKCKSIAMTTDGKQMVEMTKAAPTPTKGGVVLPPEISLKFTTDDASGWTVGKEYKLDIY